MKIFGDTHIGEVRKSNQDSFRYRILSPDLLYAVVCDGMGGERGGQVASQTAVEIIGNMLGRDIRPGIGAGEIKSVLECAVAGANATVHDMGPPQTGAERHGHYHRRGGGAGGYRLPAQRRG